MSDCPHTDPPLAEILGWERYPYCRSGWRDADGVEIAVGRPTVDDLLDWLVDQGWTWTALKWQNQVTVRVIYIETGVCAVHDLYGPTLAAALEQAVRLVHDQTEA